MTRHLFTAPRKHPFPTTASRQSESEHVRCSARSLCSSLALLFLLLSPVTTFPQGINGNISARIALGQKLFNDAALSADGRTSCASCHQPAHAYSDGRKTSQGVHGRTGTRNTPSLLTVMDHVPLFWDGRRKLLRKAVLDPIFHPSELGLKDPSGLIARLQTPAYHALFTKAFGSHTSNSALLGEVGRALAAFVRAIPRPPVAYDQFRKTHASGDMSPAARAGLQLFRGKAGCSACHRLEGKPERFSDGLFHSTGTGLQSIATQLPSLARQVAADSSDISSIGKRAGMDSRISALGRFAVTHQPSDLGTFRTPSLRYVANTAPYMHDGSVPTLSRAVEQEIYWRGLKSGHPLSLTVAERQELVAFLRALSLPVHTRNAPHPDH